MFKLMMQKGFSNILVLFGIVLLITFISGVYYFNSKKVNLSTDNTDIQSSKASAKSHVSEKDDNSTWKKYTNNKYSFSISYPDGWQLCCYDISDSSENAFFIRITKSNYPEVEDPEKIPLNINIRAFDQTNHNTSMEAAKDLGWSNSVKSAQIKGVDATIDEGTVGGEGQFHVGPTLVVIEKGREIVIGSSNVKTEEDRHLIIQILKTFSL